MRNVKHLLMAAAVAASTLLVAATPQPAAAEIASAEAAAMLPDGVYAIVDQQGRIVGYIRVEGGVVVEAKEFV